ncbi:MAG TPA: sigma-70 family RNA polymerase sigma factor, partial [Gemmataceae bacterium]|nr:sigma-70 family RNA polymerase sigma factor [Gemmataceae bacterium]
MTADRLSRIVTRWSLVCQAHGGRDRAAGQALAELLERYGGAIHRYLLAGLRDPDAAYEVTQEFALRFLRGDFQGLDPRKGRFRDYVKTILFRMVASYHKDRQARPRPLPAEVAAPLPCPADDDPDARFLATWRQEVIDNALKALAEVEQKTGQPYHTLLSLKINDPEGEVPSAELAATLTRRLGKRYTADGVRKALQRAR